MEFILELLVTAFISVLFSFLISKIVFWAMGGGVGRSDSGVNETPTIDVDDKFITEELEFSEKLKVQGFESEKKVEFVKDSADKIDVFETKQAGVDQDLESEMIVECVEETADKFDEFEAEEKEVAERLKVQGFESEKAVRCVQETINRADDLEIKVKDKIDDIDVKEKMQKEKVEESGEQLEVNHGPQVQSEEISIEQSPFKGVGKEEKEVKPESDEDDDWEGIEKSELEKVFGAAAKFVEHKGDLEGVGNDVQLELYGLHKVATEGPCREPQPMAFMVSSRSKWNAWQRLGNMNPEMAMEQYVGLLSDRVPGWMEKNSAEEYKSESADQGVPGAMGAHITSFPNQSNFKHGSNAELKPTTGGDTTASTSFEKQAKD